MSPCIVDNALTESFIYDFLYIITQTADASNDHLHLEASCFPFVVDYANNDLGVVMRMKLVTKLLKTSSTKGASEEQMINGFNNREAHRALISINKLYVEKFTLSF